MNLLTTVAVAAALLGCALIGGVFFAFSSFVMKALARMPSREGIAAMQSINVVVINPTFLGVFLGTAVLCLLVAALAVLSWGTSAPPYLLAGSASYLTGTYLLTGVGNVPLNERLAAVSVLDQAADSLWEHYLDRWTLLNTVRTGAAAFAALMLVLGLLNGGGLSGEA